MSTQPLSDQDLDVVQHPVYGTLKFPKTMGMDERNSIIDSMGPAGGSAPPLTAHPAVNMTGPVDTLKSNFNAGTQGAKPGEGLVKSTVENVGAGGGDTIRSLAHPINTAVGMGKQIYSDVSQGQDPLTAAMIRTGIGAVKNPARTIGQVGTGAIVGEMASPVVGLASKGLAKVGGMARDAAIGDPNAAALRGLQVGPKSPKAISTLGSIEGARPYLKGAQSMEDLQAKISPAKAEIWAPYKQAVDAIGGRAVRGPDGLTTVADLEAERSQLSALNRGLKQQLPEAVQLAQQKGMTAAQLFERENAVKAALDPELKSTGIDPLAIRKTFGQVSQVGQRVSGKSTLIEKPQPSGLGKIANLSLEHPLQAPQQVLGGLRDIIAGRPMFEAKPTDLGIREGFRTGGPKPNFGSVRTTGIAPPPTALLGAPAIQLGGSPEVGGTPAGYRPPPFYHDTDAMRLGRLLKAPPIQLGGTVEGPKGQPFRFDTTPMRLGRTLPEPSLDTPLSSHPDIFTEQRPGSALRRRGKTIEGKR